MATSARDTYPRLFGPTGQRLYPSPTESPGKFKRRPKLARSIRKSISQYDHSELLEISTSLSGRIPALRAAIRKKNSWAFGDSWHPLYCGTNEKWGEAVEEWLMHMVFPNALFRELRPNLRWGMKITGMELDIHGDNLAVFTEDEQHFPKLAIVPAPRIGNEAATSYAGGVTNYSTGYREDGMSVVKGGRFDGAPIYNGIIWLAGKPVGIRVLGWDDAGKPVSFDFGLGFGGGTHYACETEWSNQGRAVPRIAASILQLMKKEEIDDLFLKGLALAASKTVIHKLKPGTDVPTARGNALDIGTTTNSDGDDEAVFVEYAEDGNVTYIGADEDLAGLDFQNPHPNVEQFAVRVLRECLDDLGFSYEFLDLASTGRAPTRLAVELANASIWERQSTLEERYLAFTRYAIAKGMKHGFIPRNDDGMDPYLWEFGLPKQMSVDAGNDVTAQLNRLKMGLTNERIEAAKDGQIAKRILKERIKEGQAKIDAALALETYAKSKGAMGFSFEKAFEFLYQPNPNSNVQANNPPGNEPNATPGNTSKP